MTGHTERKRSAKHLGIRFMPTGGVSEANTNDYHSIPEVAAVGGTWLGKPTDIVEEKIRCD